MNTEIGCPLSEIAKRLKYIYFLIRHYKDSRSIKFYIQYKANDICIALVWKNREGLQLSYYVVLFTCHLKSGNVFAFCLKQVNAASYRF